jgi:twinkle protein
VLVIVVAHPGKEGGLKDPSKMSLYDISDSAHWANKPDFGLVVFREAESLGMITHIKVAKIRYQPVAGTPGMVTMRYNVSKKLFEPPDASPYRTPYEPRYRGGAAPVADAEEPPF